MSEDRLTILEERAVEKYVDIIANKETERTRAAVRGPCVCVWTGRGNYPKQYLKFGFRGGDRQWCEKCEDVPADAAYLDNSICCTPECTNKSLYTNDGTRDNRICGKCKKVLPKEVQATYENVVNPKCVVCKKQFPGQAIVPEGETYETTQPTHCGKCVDKLPEDERDKYEDVNAKRCIVCKEHQPSKAIVPEGDTRETTQATHCGPCVEALPEDERKTYEDVKHERCEEDGCETRATYAEDYAGFPAKFCGYHGPRNFVHTGKKPCPGADEEGRPRAEGIGCPRAGTILKGKSSELCAWCDPKGHTKQFEDAVLNQLKEMKYGVDDQYEIDAYGRKRAHFIDGVILFDGVVVAIEVDEKSGHKDKDEDERRMIVCEEFLEEQHGVPVAWVRIVPDISGGKRVLGKGVQFGEKAIAIRRAIVHKAAATIDDILENPRSGVFYFDQNSL
jgi:hypothetical protein